MRRPGSAVSKEGELAGVITTLNCHSTQEIGHLAVDNFSNTPRGVNRPNTERLRDLVVHGAGGSLNVETHATTDEVFRVENAKQEIRVRDSRFGAAAAVAHGSWIGTRAHRADRKLAETNCRNAAAAGSDRFDVDRRYPNVGATYGYLAA